jgi:PEP-CTERM motif
MKRMNRFMIFGLVAGLVFLAAPAVQAAFDPAVTFTGNTSTNFVTPAETVGWQFAVSGNILVTGLGVFDSGQDGLLTNHTVGIWLTSAPATLLASGTVASGTAGTLVNQFRYVSIAPTLLVPGTYTIGATWGPIGDTYIAGSPLPNFHTDSRITFLGAEYIEAVPLTMPNTSASFFGQGIFGPNLSVPEPGTLILLGSGLLGLAIAGSRKKFRK